MTVDTNMTTLKVARNLEDFVNLGFVERKLLVGIHTSPLDKPNHISWRHIQCGHITKVDVGEDSMARFKRLMDVGKFIVENYCKHCIRAVDAEWAL